MKVNNLNATPSPVVKNNNAKNIPFKGLIEDLKPTNLFKLKRGGPMGANLFILNAFAFLLGTRLITSRDKDEKREILVRDIPSIVIAVVGVDTIEKKTAQWFHKNKGFAIMDKNGEGKLEGVKYSQLKDWYTYDKNLDSSTGLKGFSERLSNLGGKLQTVYSSLGDDIKAKLANYKENKDVIEKITQDKTLGEQIKSALSDAKTNKALKKAEMLKTWPTIIGFALTLSLLGIIIPKTNIFVTERINKKRKAEELAAQKKQVQQTPVAEKST